MFRFNDYVKAMAKVMEEEAREMFERGCKALAEDGEEITSTTFEEALTDNLEEIALMVIKEDEVEITLEVEIDGGWYPINVCYTFIPADDSILCNGYGYNFDESIDKEIH